MKTKTGHTPGPWRQARAARQNLRDPLFYHVNVVSGGKCVAVASGIGADEATANARLIAAAPELLEALKMLVMAAQGASLEPMGLAIEMGERAIAKARGAEEEHLSKKEMRAWKSIDRAFAKAEGREGK